MKAKPYKWVNNHSNNEVTVQQNKEEVSVMEQNTAEESAMEQISSNNITQIVQLVEKLIDLTIDDSVRAEQVTKQLLQKANKI